MNKLICYAISRAALQRLNCGAGIPSEWFNWVGTRLPGLGYNARRLCMAEKNGAPWSLADIVEWDKANRALGFDTALLLLRGEAMAGYRFFHLDSRAPSAHPELGLLTLERVPEGNEQAEQIRQELQEPDPYLMEAFCDLRGGGGLNLQVLGYDLLEPAHWWSVGDAFGKWVKEVTSPQGAAHHPAAYPLNDWREYSRGNEKEYTEDICLTLERYFVAASSPPLQALRDYDSPEKAWCEDNVPGFEDWRLDGEALKAVYPERSLPFCGVAETLKGELKPYGGFASLKEPWAWDAKGEVRGAILAYIRERDRVRAVSPGRSGDGLLGIGLRLLAQTVFTPQPLGAAEGRHIGVEVNEFEMRVDIWIDTDQSSGTTAFLVTPRWPDMPLNVLNVEFIFDRETAVMEVNGENTNLIRIHDNNAVEGVFLTTPTQDIEVRVYADSGAKND